MPTNLDLPTKESMKNLTSFNLSCIVTVHRRVTLQNYKVVLHTNAEEKSCFSFTVTLEELYCFIGLQLTIEVIVEKNTLVMHWWKEE